ncbi:MAG: protease [Methanothermococcus sp.]|jgi:protease I|uniref:type 1 glutamine amidotransferase domain-containing protein n=1 Tax=Methanothermococcus TaxID=155862 RepID=UPI0003800276|nr:MULTISPECIES: type 1 glutamine amidotransferase domain-containing protein [Methanothermococcus]MDK2790078.1 protease [Methanothermococcus sp.]MDK2987986.1 protease [Methanothermococcus sp.]
MNILILSADGFEDLELFYPYFRLMEEGYNVQIASNKRKIEGKKGYKVIVDLKFSEVNPDDYDGLVLPGGIGPETVRLDINAVNITKNFMDDKKPVASICQGIQVLISAGEIKGKKAVCWYGVKDDLIAAGGIFVDKGVVVDDNLVSSRHPWDLSEFMGEYLKKFE